jgi:hypothetical protein
VDVNNTYLMSLTHRISIEVHGDSGTDLSLEGTVPEDLTLSRPVPL